jgi:hypothetical protein
VCNPRPRGKGGDTIPGAREMTPAVNFPSASRTPGHSGGNGDAVRMRVQRSRLQSRRQGRRVCVSAASVERLG